MLLGTVLVQGFSHDLWVNRRMFVRMNDDEHMKYNTS